MLALDIPGFGAVSLHYLVTDFSGTLSVDGRLMPGVAELLNEVADVVEVHVLTADTFGRARAALAGVRCRVQVLDGGSEDRQKEEYVERLGAARVIALGNGNNDRRMLKRARIGIAVCLKEGCARDAAAAADILTTSTIDALELLLQEKRLFATLRF